MSKPCVHVVCCRIASRVVLALALGGACVKAQATVTCLFTTIPGIFENYDPSVAAPTDFVPSVVVNCTSNNNSGETADVVLSVGAGIYGTVANRQMQISGGTQRLLYNLYRDSARAQIWGDVVGIDTMLTTITGIKKIGRTVTFTIYGRIPALQNIDAGNYTDSVQIRITP